MLSLYFILFGWFAASSVCDNLILIDEDELITKLPNSNDWDFIIQNPYQGLVEVLRSPTNKFQILLNGTFEDTQDLSFHYVIRTGSNEVFLQVSNRIIQQSHYTDAEEDTVYLQLLLITVASLVLVVFVVSIIFSCWWIKSRQENAETTPCYVDATEKFESKAMLGDFVDGQMSGVEDCVGQTCDVKITSGGGEYSTFATVAKDLSISSGPMAVLMDESQSSFPGTTHTLPRYTIAGSSGAGTDDLRGTQPLTNFDSFVISTRTTSTTPEAPLQGWKVGLAATTGRTRHVAKEFLDESVLNTAARKRVETRTDLQPLTKRPPLSNLVSAAPGAQQVLLVPAGAVGGSTGRNTVETAFILASSTDGIVRSLSPIGVVESLEAMASPTAQCFSPPLEMHFNPTVASTGGTLFVQMDSRQSSGMQPSQTELQGGRDSSALLQATGSPALPMLTGDFLAEMAACPQHSYLVRQQMNPVFDGCPLTTAIDTASTAAAAAAVGEETMSTVEATVMEIPEADPLPSPPPETTTTAWASSTAEDLCEASTKVVGEVERDQESIRSSETLPRSKGRNNSHSSPVDLDKPGSAATLPAGGHAGGRKSALKGAGGSKVSKQIRFTVLNLVAVSCIVTIAMAANVEDGPFVDVNVILPPFAPGSHTTNFSTASGDSFSSSSTSSSPRHEGRPYLRITVWIPDYFVPDDARPKNFQWNGNASSTDLADRPPHSIQLWLNRTSHTEVHLGKTIHRNAVEIYDAVDARWIQSTRSCRQRYVCEHSCDPGAGHACICQRGYRPAGPEDRGRLLGYGGVVSNGIKGQGRVCLDVDECENPAVRAECKRRGGVCTNRPGDHQCLCPSGQSCLACDTRCSRGFWLYGNCSRGQPLECKRCSEGCPSGMYIARPCTTHSDLVCRACRPLCISEEFEFTPCKGSSNRECRRKDIIPELLIPHKRRVWFEDQRKVKDVSFILTAETQRRLLVNRTIILDRSSGYQVQLEFEMVHLEPILEPVNHSASNDNAHFLASAREATTGSGEVYKGQWFGGSASDPSMTHQQQGLSENWHRANETLARLCPYPIPPVYHLTMLVHRNVTVATDPDQSLPGYRPILSSCTTYEQHGHFPPPGSTPTGEERRDFYGDAEVPLASTGSLEDDLGRLRGGFYPAFADDAFAYSGAQRKSSSSSQATEAPTISCLEPSKLPTIFGTEWNNELAAPQTAFYEEKIQCAQLKEACRACLVGCAEEIKSSSLSCKPTAGPADNGRSGRLETCFDCCAKDDCTYVCGKYSAHRCLMRLCSRGTRLDFRLTPEWPKENPFICHVQPAPKRPIYKLRWSLLYKGSPPTKQAFTASLSLNQPISGPQSEPFINRPSQPATDNAVRRLPDGTLNQLFRGLLNVDYSLGLSHIPDIISGSANSQAAYYWSTQTIPLLHNSMAGGSGGSGGGGGGGARSGDSVGMNYPFLTPFTASGTGPVKTPSLLVWPSKPFEVNTDLWRRLSAAPCESADPLLEKLNVYTPALAPYTGMTDVQITYKAPYLYSISHVRVKPKLNFSLSKDASFLGSIFEPASVERGHSLRASLILDTNYGVEDEEAVGATMHQQNFIVGASSASPVQRSYWVIDLSGQVSHFPGLFRLKLYPEEGGGANGNSEDGADEASEDFGELDKFPEGEPMLDYEVGVFEENKFQLRILIPAPDEEPDYEKSFYLVILDAKNLLRIRVRRAVQPPVEMQQRRMYTFASSSSSSSSSTSPASGNTLSSLAALVPSLAARQLRETNGGGVPQSANRPLIKRAIPDTHPSLTADHLVLPIGPSAELVYVLILLLLLLFVIYVLGHITQPDPLHYWISCTPAETSDPNATTSAAIFTFRSPEKATPLTYWRRVFVLVIYLCLKSTYTFSVTLTALIIVARYFTREPTQQLSNMVEWSGVGGLDHSQSIVSIARQKLLKDAMDAHLKAELRRQQGEALEMHRACFAGIDKMFDKMEEAFDVTSRRAASRRSRVLVSQAVAEYARAVATAAVLEFANGLAEFNSTAQWAIRRLKTDLEGTESLLASSDWLAGARIIYEEVARLRGLTPDPADPTRPFLQWAKLLPLPHDTTYTQVPLMGFDLPPHLPTFNPDALKVPTPPVWNDGAEANQFSQSDDDGDAFETRYGPPYIPFAYTVADMDNDQSAWSVYEEAGEKSDTDKTDWPKDLLQSGAGKWKTSSRTTAPRKTDAGGTGGVAFADVFQLSWVHLLCFTLFLDALWLVHRVLHTVDTAERILYGEPIVIDCTDKGLKRRLMKRNRFRKGAKSAFKTFMQPDCVRKICAGALALLLVCLASAHVKDILSEEVLDYTGYYDNLMMDVHLHARFVNLHIVGSAKRLTHQELATTEAHAEHRYQEAQFLLYHWTGWLNRVETEQCRVLLLYKDAARTLRAKISSEEGFNVVMSHTRVAWSRPNDYSYPPPQLNASSSNEAFVPRHCRLSMAEREAELRASRRLKPPNCPIGVITPRLFQGYNASEYFAAVVAQSRGWLSSVQEWVGILLTCVFAFVSTIILWNSLGAVVWFFSLRFNLISRKVLYESDITSWRKPLPTDS